MTHGRIAFLAPLKAPDHPVASGDRAMGRALIAALAEAGYETEVVSTLRLLNGDGDLALHQRHAGAAACEAARYLADVGARPPAALFTYHCHFKAPDLIGPHLAAALDIPWLIAEPSSAGKRAGGRWDAGHRAAEAAFDAADVLLAMTARDRDAFARDAVRAEKLVALPPFLARMPEPGLRAAGDGPLRLLTMAMMRESNKRLSYLALAGALGHLDDIAWTLTIAGDGPARREIEGAFARFGDRVRFLGLLTDPAALDRLRREADLFVWPAVTEAYGMSFLEAQASGLPCVAGRDGGVADVVEDGETGLLTPPSDARAFAAAIRMLAADRARRERLGRNAAEFVRTRRSLPSAAGILDAAIILASERHAARRRSGAA